MTLAELNLPEVTKQLQRNSDHAVLTVRWKIGLATILISAQEWYNQQTREQQLALITARLNNAYRNLQKAVDATT